MRTKPSLRRPISLGSILLSACAVGVDAGDDPLLGGDIDPAISVDAGLAPPAPGVDSGPVYVPLPPNLGLPQDAGQPTVREGGVETRAPIGGGGSRGAGAMDAGSSGGSRTPTTTTRDAGRGGTSTTTGCQASKCTNSCGLDGPINCCTLLDTCGCTWAPGAYCL